MSGQPPPGPCPGPRGRRSSLSAAGRRRRGRRCGAARTADRARSWCHRPSRPACVHRVRG
ncbi:hypothetical protein FM102_01465 [Corynebacterium glutamicum]|nr:hypothetical protein FM102_01465 [Corynebacterium glutamicum]